MEKNPNSSIEAWAHSMELTQPDLFLEQVGCWVKPKPAHRNERRTCIFTAGGVASAWR